MNASFWAIYKRGRIGSRNGSEDEMMQQAERFGVACLAFCLRYDATFRAEFLAHICGCQYKAQDWSIEVDPNHEGWSDLLITSVKVAVLVECKVGNAIMKKQNPWDAESAFTKKPQGYGHQFRDRFKLETLYYTLLTESIQESPTTLLGIECCTATWDDVSKLCHSDAKMLNDLFTTLGNLHYPSFRMLKAKDLHFSDLSPILAAHEILKAVAAELKLSVSTPKADCSINEDKSGNVAGGCLGVNIPANTRNAWISEIIKPARDIGWFGYELSGSGNKPSFSELSVYFYCGTAATAREVVRRAQNVSGWKRNEKGFFTKKAEEYYLRFTRPLVSKETPAKHFVAFLKAIVPSAETKGRVKNRSASASALGPP